MIKPAKGRILIKKLSRKEAETDSGVVIPGQALQEESLLYGEVIEHNESDEVKQIKPGSKIFYSKYSATKVNDNKGNPFYLVSDLDVMAYDR